MEIGRKLISDEVKNTITEVVENRWSTVIKAYPDTDKNEFLENSISHSIPQSIGNFEYMKNRIQYLVHECENWNDLNNLIEKDMYMRIYKIEENDSKRTITAKIKAFMEGRKYKGGSNKEVIFEKFYIRNRDESLKEKEGELYKYKKLKCYIHKNEKGKYVATEARTGMSIVTGMTNKSELKKKVKEIVNSKWETTEQTIERIVDKFGDLAENK